MFLIDNILLAPIKGVYKLGKVLHDRAYDQLYDPKSIKEELLKLQLQLEMDEITEDEYDAYEEILLDRLEESQS